jgi:hypothetical protein
MRAVRPVRESGVLHALVDLRAGLFGEDRIDVEDDAFDRAGEREARPAGVLEAP